MAEIKLAGGCASLPGRRPPGEHAWHMVDWLEETDVLWGAAMTGQSSWQSVSWWLRMVAGLTEVQMDLASQSVASKFMACKTLIHYEDAVSETASGYHTEVTRMLYAYAALENAVRTIDPSVGEGSVESSTEADQ